MSGGLGFDVSERVLKLEPPQHYELVITIDIQQSKQHTLIQNLAQKSQLKEQCRTRLVVTRITHGGRRGTRAHVRKT